MCVWIKIMYMIQIKITSFNALHILIDPQRPRAAGRQGAFPKTYRLASILPRREMFKAIHGVYISDLSISVVIIAYFLKKNIYL